MSTDYARYSRQIVLREVGVNGQSLLQDSTVLVIGLGGLGAPAALYLAGAGVGRLILSDHDHVALSNLHRQIVYREADIGRTKLDATADTLSALNHHGRIDARPGPLDEAALLAAVHQADIVLDCSDNFPTRYAINAACVTARKPLVSGAAIRFEGQLAVFHAARGGPCYACLYPQAAGETAETCEEAGILGPVTGVVGSMQALMALQHLLGIGEGPGTLHLWDAVGLKWRRLTIAADPACRVCHPSHD